MFWTVLVRVTAVLPDGRSMPGNAMATTNIASDQPKPSGIAMGLVNEIRRSFAADRGVPVDRVLVDWFDCVVADEPYQR